MNHSTEERKSNPLITSIIITGLIIMLALTFYYLSQNNKIREPDPTTSMQAEQRLDRTKTQLQANQEQTTQAAGKFASDTEQNQQTTIEATRQDEQQEIRESLITNDDGSSQVTGIAIIEEPFKESALDHSDRQALIAALQISSHPQLFYLLMKQEMIRNLVVFVDNFARGELNTNFSPLNKSEQAFSAAKINQKFYLNEQSYQRYNVYADLISSIDIDEAIQQYKELKPLIEEAYQEIGNPGQTFTDRLYSAIDLVLQAPVIDGPIELIAPSAMYKFADNKLETLFDAEKLLLRMGPENTLKIQEKLLQFKQALQASAD